MTNTTKIWPASDGQIEGARALAHRAVQHLTALARANLEAAPDDSHSSLIWNTDLAAFETQLLGDVRAGLKLVQLELYIGRIGGEITHLALSGRTTDEVDAWLDEQAELLGLEVGSPVKIPYELPEEVAAISIYSTHTPADGLEAIACWYSASAEALEKVREQTAHFNPGPGPVRCWPHHFDIATYIALENGDPEAARGVGAGMSPGDESNGLPYLYVNPWPHLNASDLPDAVSPGHWHTNGYVGLVATSEEIGETSDPEAAIDGFLQNSVSTAILAQGLG